MALGSKQVLPGGDPFREPPPRRQVTGIPVTPVTWLLMAVSLALFAVGWVSPEVREAGVLHGPLVQRGEWWRLATWLVTHGGVLHLAFNLSVVWTLGRMLEFSVGPWRFLLATAAGALGSSAAVLAFDFDAPTVGLSGVILAWAGMALPVANEAARRHLAVWLLQVIAISLLPGVSWSGHLGGFLSGLLAGGALRLGRVAYARAMPVLLFALGVLVVLAGQGRLP